MSRIIINRQIVASDTNYILRVWVSETTNNIPGALFVMQVLPELPDVAPVLKFDRVATPADLSEISEGEGSWVRTPYFRKTFQSLGALEDFRQDVDAQCNELMSSLESLDVTSPESEDIVIGES